MPASPSSLLGPLRIPLYRNIWLATLLSNLGVWIQSVAAAWLMTDLSVDPLMVSLVQVSSSVPMFLLALPAGALADIVDKRRLLISAESAIVAISAAFASAEPGCEVIAINATLKRFA